MSASLPAWYNFTTTADWSRLFPTTITNLLLLIGGVSVFVKYKPSRSTLASNPLSSHVTQRPPRANQDMIELSIVVFTGSNP